MDVPRKKDADLPRGPWQNNIKVSMILSLVVPVILAITLRWYYANDAASIAIAGAVPVLWVVLLYARRRRVDWLGVIAAIGFGTGLAVSPLAAVSEMPLKVYHPTVAGAVGIVFLVSAAVGRPMFALFVRAYNISGPDRVERLGNPEVIKKLSFWTALAGSVFLVEAAAQIVLAITLPTPTYLRLSGAVIVAAVFVLITVILLAVKRSK